MTFETLLTQPAVQSLGWALIHFVWQGSLVAALLWVANALTPQTQLRYGIACIAMMLMPSVFIATHSTAIHSNRRPP